MAERTFTFEAALPVEYPRGNAFTDVWQGRRSLAQTFWFWGVLMGFVVAFGGVLLAIVAQSYIRPWLALVLLIALVMPYHFWASVGLLRSSENSSSSWAGIARVLALLGIVGTAFRIISMLLSGPAAFFGA